jgi:small neutral amino acid transporter SnatA (MarC family)
MAIFSLGLATFIFQFVTFSLWFWVGFCGMNPSDTCPDWINTSLYPVLIFPIIVGPPLIVTIVLLLKKKSERAKIFFTLYTILAAFIAFYIAAEFNFFSSQGW